MALKVNLKEQYSSLWETHLRAIRNGTLPVILWANLPPDAMNALTPARQACTQVTYSEGWKTELNLGDWLHTEMVYSSLELYSFGTDFLLHFNNRT